MTTIGIIYNQSKSRRILKHFMNELRAYEDIHLLSKPTTDFQDGIAKTIELAQHHCDLIVAVGGDGTVLSVINGLMTLNKLSIPLAILPTGTGNDFAHELNIYHYRDTIQAIRNKQIKAIDLIKCTYIDSNNVQQEHYANSSAGVGLLSSVFALQSNRAYRCLKIVAGSFTYPLVSFVKMLFTKSHPVIIDIDNVLIQTHIDMLQIRKTKITGPVSLVPFAKPDSGYLDMVVFHGASLLRRIKIAIQMFTSKDKIIDKHIDYFGNNEFDNKHNIINPKRILIKANEQLPLDLNGEFLGYTPCEIEILPKRISILTA